MPEQEELRKQLDSLLAEHLQLRTTRKELSDHILNLEARLAVLQGPKQEPPGLDVKVLAAALARAVAEADTVLANEPQGTQYALSGVDCEVKGFLVPADGSFRVVPADSSQSAPAGSLSAVRFRVVKLPSGT